MEKENHLKKQKTIITIIIVILLSVLILGISYAFFTAVIHSNSENKITTGVINFSYTENENAINLQNASSMTDEEGIANENYFGFNLNVTATGTIKLYYYIYFTVIFTRAFFLPPITVITQVPLFFAVIFPWLLTVAILLLDVL